MKEGESVLQLERQPLGYINLYVVGIECVRDLRVEGPLGVEDNVHVVISELRHTQGTSHTMYMLCFRVLGAGSEDHSLNSFVRISLMLRSIEDLAMEISVVESHPIMTTQSQNECKNMPLIVEPGH